jgi:hypothetical protein
LETNPFFGRSTDVPHDFEPSLKKARSDIESALKEYIPHVTTLLRDATRSMQPEDALHLYETVAVWIHRLIHEPELLQTWLKKLPTLEPDDLQEAFAEKVLDIIADSGEGERLLGQSEEYKELQARTKNVRRTTTGIDAANTNTVPALLELLRESDDLPEAESELFQ